MHAYELEIRKGHRNHAYELEMHKMHAYEQEMHKNACVRAGDSQESSVRAEDFPKSCVRGDGLKNSQESCVRIEGLHYSQESMWFVQDPIHDDRIPVEAGAEPVPIPCTPSESEKVKHELTHIPFKPRCT